MKEELKILKLGTKNEDYPYFCQHVCFENNIRTANGKVYVQFDENKFPIEGCVNLYALENVLNNCEVPKIEQDNRLLNIEDGDYKSSLNIDSMDFPTHQPLDVRFTKLDEELLYMIKTASKFVGDGLFSYVYINEDYVLASLNKEKLFYYKHDADVEGVIGINRKILPTLSEGIEVGTLNHNTVVKFEGGKIIFGIALLNNYPSDFIIKKFEEKPECHKLCNVALLQNAVNKVSSILVNEKIKKVYLSNEDNKLAVTAESVGDGVSRFLLESEIKQTWEGEFYHDFLKGIDLDYDVFVNFENKDIYLSNEGGANIIIGGG